MWQVINSSIYPTIMLIGVFCFGRIIINKPVEISNKVFGILVLAIIIFQTMVGLYIKDTLKTVLIVITNILFYKYTFKISTQKSIFLSFLQMFFLVIPDLLQLFFITKILNISKKFYYTQYAGSIFGNLLTCILFIIIVYISRKPLRKLIDAKIENNVKIIIFVILTFICTGMFFYTLIKEFRFSDNIFVYIVSITFFVSMLISLIKQTIDNNKLTREYDELLEFMVTYENEIEKQRILRHEVKNEFRTIRAKICDKQEDKEIVEYIDEIINDKYEVRQEEYAKFGYLPPNGIKGLCYFKVQEAEDKGIKVALNISKRIKQSTIYELDTKDQRDFGRILGVFLDNAIEASLNSEQKQLGIEAYMNKEKECKMIISNTYNNKVDKEKLGKEPFSTKGKTRGHGLLLVNRITENNKLFETSTDIQEKIYIQKVIIKNRV